MFLKSILHTGETAEQACVCFVLHVCMGELAYSDDMIPFWGLGYATALGVSIRWAWICYRSDITYFEINDGRIRPASKRASLSKEYGCETG